MNTAHSTVSTAFLYNFSSYWQIDFVNRSGTSSARINKGHGMYLLFHSHSAHHAWSYAVIVLWAVDSLSSTGPWYMCCIMPHLHQIHVARTQVVSLVAIYMSSHLHVSCIDKTTKLSSQLHVFASRTLLRTCIRRHVDGYKLLVRDTCIRLHVSGVNAA